MPIYVLFHELAGLLIQLSLMNEIGNKKSSPQPRDSLDLRCELVVLRIDLEIIRRNLTFQGLSDCYIRNAYGYNCVYEFMYEGCVTRVQREAAIGQRPCKYLLASASYEQP